MSPLVVTLLVIILLLLTRLILNLVNPPSKLTTFNLSPFTRPNTSKVSCADCFITTNCEDCPVDCKQCSLSCPPNCATCTPSCSKCNQDCPADCNKCKAHCPPDCNKCKVKCPPDCNELLSKCELPFTRCQAFSRRMKFSGGYLTSPWKPLPSSRGWVIIIRFIPSSMTGGLLSFSQMGFYLEHLRVKMYLQDDIKTLTPRVDPVINTLRFSQGLRKNYFALSINGETEHFPPKVLDQFFDSTITLGKCIGPHAPAASKIPFIGCMQDVQINLSKVSFTSMRVTQGVVIEGCE